MRTLIVLCALLSLAAGPAAAQEERDPARKAILEEELAAEARQFMEARAELLARPASAVKIEDATERVNRHRRNMAELAREIARTEGDVLGKPSRPRPSADDWLIRVQPAKGESPEWLVPADRKRR